jgi:hypothetical protein
MYERRKGRKAQRQKGAKAQWRNGSMAGKYKNLLTSTNGKLKERMVYN